MKIRLHCGFGFLMLWAFVASGQSPAPVTPAQAVASVSQAQPSLKLGPGDLIHITVYSMPELEQHVRVSDEGTVSLSLIGELKVTGMTADELSLEIAKRLREGEFVKRPNVTVLVDEYTTQGVAVIGEVVRPSVIPIYSGRNLLDILSAAGGLKDTASTEILIRRQGQSGAPEKVQLGRDGKSLSAPVADVNPGDQVIVPLAGIVYLLGDLNRPGGYVMSENGKITLLQALAMAGGPTRTAAENSARLLRTTATGYAEQPLPLKDIMKGKRPDLELQPRDIVYVPFSLIKNTLLGSQAILGAASSAAVYRFP
jgi:polysaccharide export outer membrane protein